MPKVREVIESQIHRGEGTKADPHRMVTQFHDLDGTFLWENDPTPTIRCPLVDDERWWHRADVQIAALAQCTEGDQP